MDLLYPALCAPLAMLAVRAWAHAARSASPLAFVAGVLAGAAAIDAARVLLERIEDTPDGMSRNAFVALAGAGMALLVYGRWRTVRGAPPPSRH